MILTHEGKHIGQIRDRVFGKMITKSNQLMGIYGGTPGVQDTIDKYLDHFDSITIKTYDDTVFSTSKENWLSNRERKDFGHGGQYFMYAKHWDIQHASVQGLGL